MPTPDGTAPSPLCYYEHPCGAESSDMTLSRAGIQGDTQVQSAERFLASLPPGTLPESWSDKDKDALVKLIDTEARDRRLLPVMQLEVQAGDQLIPLYLFKVLQASAHRCL